MRKFFRRLQSVVAFLLVAACSAVDLAAPDAPTVPPTLGDAVNTARTFLDAWTKGDFNTMYGLLSPRSLVISREAFTAAYQQAEQTLNLFGENAKRFRILDDQTQRQGNTAIVRYDMTFNSRFLGEFTDSGRTMRLLLTERGWRVAWSTMDIFEGLAGGAQLVLERTPPLRGSIYDRNGKIIAQDNVPNYAVRLLTRRYPTGNPDDCFRALAETFRLYIGDFEQYRPFTGQDFGFTVGTLFQSDYEALRPSLDRVCFLQYVPQTTRFYYGGNIAAQTVGFVTPIQADQQAAFPNLAPGSLVGQFGVERAWQEQLSGESGAELLIRTADGVTVRTIHRKPASRGQDVHLSLDRELQLKTEQAIAAAYNEANWAPLRNGAAQARLVTGAAAVVLDVKTGDVLAMASFPSPHSDAWRIGTTWDATDVIGRYFAQRAVVNHATEELYALGSVMKIVSTAAAADSGAFRMDETRVCKGTLRSPDDGRILTDWIYLEPNRDPNYHGEINLHQALTSSCDIYFWLVGEKLNGIDPTLIKRYANKLGLGVPTGIDSLVDLQGVIPDPEWTRANEGRAWGVGDSLNIVIGQGSVKVTVLQAARMTAAVANGEVLPNLTLVKKVGYAGQPPTYVAPERTPEPLGIKPEVINGVQLGMCEVITDPKLGTANWVFTGWDHSRVKVCGKTGTVQSGTPYPHGWFVAYAGLPNQPPDIAIAVLVLYSREGSETGAPIARRIIEAYYGLPYAPFPRYWAEPYQVLPTPGLSGGQ